MESWYAAVASFVGGAGLAGLLKFFTRNREMTHSNEAALRLEMQSQIEKLNLRIEHLEQALADYQDKYLKLYKQNADLIAQLGEHNGNGNK